MQLTPSRTHAWDTAQWTRPLIWPLQPIIRPLLRRLALQIMARIELGSISVTLPGGQTITHTGTRSGPHGQITMLSWRALTRCFMRGDLGLAESFIAGEWTSANLPQLIALMAVNLDMLDVVMDGAKPTLWLRRVIHAVRSNSMVGSQRNIAFHYDLGNDFYRLWLDDSMTYSSAIAIEPAQTLDAAQAHKLARIAELLQLSADHTVLEIGCGWGALAARLAPLCGHVTGITLSQEQLAFARERVTRSGMTGKIDFQLRDYRLVDETYDRIVSIEMLEAVGEEWWPTYFRQLHDRLKPGGRAVVQVITIAENRFDHYRGAPDFIQNYIFPGGMLPTRAILAQQTAAAGLRMVAQEQFGAGYAATLAEWRRRFHAAWPQIAALGFGDQFHRLWDYYLCYCEGGFASGATDVGLYVLEKDA